MTNIVDILARAGLNAYLTFFDGVLARLLMAVGEPQQARDRLDAALSLARDTRMHSYDAELLRLRGHTHTDPRAIGADLQAALDLAHRQGPTCSNYALLSTVSNCMASPPTLPSLPRSDDCPPTPPRRSGPGARRTRADQSRAR